MIHTSTPKTITLPIIEFCKSIDGENAPIYIPVVADPEALIMDCRDNVMRRIGQCGGAIQFGWAIWEWPKVLLEAEFHAIWQSPEGEYIDITPKPIMVERILFLPDNIRRYDDNWDGKRYLNVRRPLTRDPIVKEYIRTFDEYDRCIEENSTALSVDPKVDGISSYFQSEIARLYLQILQSQEPANCKGKIMQASAPNRNSPCSCGSGKKYKKCCGKG
ncbi:MAG: SEC-C metal-binding domain-containing protein [candidate division Zixibacteria bacterium]|nr:SEC-C metal-binding domain-containing protein [candidate division Zixibacteria bacterium]